MTTTADWYFEGPDESVGIFGTLVEHQCGDVGEAEQTAETLRSEGTEVVQTRTYTCPCGATTNVVDRWPQEWLLSEPGGDE